MRTSTVAQLTNILPFLTTVAAGATRQARVGNRVRLYRTEPVALSADLGLAVAGLLAAGAVVKVYEGNIIYTPTLDGATVVWNARNTRKCRDAVVVEVAL